MIQGFDPIRDTFLADLENLTTRMTATQAQISAGVRVGKPSDDPAAVGDIIQLEFDIGRVTQTTQNLYTFKGEVDTAELALQSAGSLLIQARSLAVQGTNATQTAAQRGVLALQVQGILEELANISRTVFGGRYVFSGDQALSPAYQINLANANGVDRLLTAPATRLARDVSGTQFTVALTAEQIFDHRNPDDTLAADNVFTAVNSLRVALAANNQAGITTALDSLTQAQDYFEQQHSFYGATQNRLTKTLDLAQNYHVQWQASLSQARDTDIVAASTQLAQENLNQQAALQAQASMHRTTLFDYLK